MSRQDYGPPPIEEGYEEGELGLFIGNMSEWQTVAPSEDLEERLTDVVRYFSGQQYKEGNSKRECL